jgi:cell division protein FtsB
LRVSRKENLGPASKEAAGMERRTRIRWDRLGRWALIAVLGLILYLYIGPAATWVSTYKEAKRKRAEVAALKAENRRLVDRRRELRDPAALERQARRLGMVKAGEKSYVIEGLPKR